MRLALMGSTDFSATVLQSLIDHNYNIVSLYTKKPSKKKRGLKISYSPVHTLGLEHNIAICTPENFKDQLDIDQFHSFNLDLAIVVAYGLILPPCILKDPIHGCLNIHASLLPKWRGAAPIERCIEAGDEFTGITLMQMNEKLDAGNIICTKSLPITSEDTTSTISHKLQSLAINLLIDKLAKLKKNNMLLSTPQDHSKASYANKLSKCEGLINFTQNANVILNKIQAFNPYPGSYFYINGEMLKIKMASIVNNQTSDEPAGSIIVKQDKLYIVAGDQKLISIYYIQRSGKKPLAIKEFLKGYKFSSQKL